MVPCAVLGTRLATTTDPILCLLFDPEVSQPGFIFTPALSHPSPPLLPQLIFILQHVSIHALFQGPLTRAPHLKESWPLPRTSLFCLPSVGTRVQGVSYQGGFLLLLEGLHPGLEFFFGRHLGCQFNPLKLFGTNDKGLPGGILCGNSVTRNEQG